MKKKDCEHRLFSSVNTPTLFGKDKKAKVYSAVCELCGEKMKIRKYELGFKVVI